MRIAVITAALALALWQPVAAPTPAMAAGETGTGMSPAQSMPQTMPQSMPQTTPQSPPMRKAAKPAMHNRTRTGTTALQNYNLPSQVKADIRDREGPRQRTRELVQTTLLNQFGALGFAELGPVHKQGDTYTAQVKTVEGKWVQVTVDPNTGKVTVPETVGSKPPTYDALLTNTGEGAAAQPMPGTTTPAPMTGPSMPSPMGGGQSMPAPQQ